MKAEESELQEKKLELEKVTALLADKELDLENLRASVARFQHRYYAELGKKYVELDELRAQIAERRAQINPQDSDLKYQAQSAREDAAKAAREYNQSDCQEDFQPGPGDPPEALKKLYRKVASAVHPDKATDERSRKLRTKLMADLNEAYARRDTERMKAILAEWDESPDAVPGEGMAAELVRTIRAIAQVKRRISEIEGEIAGIMATDIHQLMIQVQESHRIGRNILLEMAKAVEQEIRDAQEELCSIGM